MASKRKVAEKIEKEDVLRAVLIADDFDDTFGPYLQSECSIFLPLTSRKIIDFALEWLSCSGVQETILFCSAKADAIKKYISSSQYNKEGIPMKIVVMVSESCMSIGDALRDIDNKGLIKSDFILLSTSSVTNLPLQNILKDHKALCKRDRGTAMTMVLQDVGCSPKGKETMVAVNSETNRLILYSKNALQSKIELSMENISEHPQMTIWSTLKDTGIAICSPAVPLLFSDNFDFQTKDDFIRGLLLNEEVLASSIYCNITTGYGNTVNDWPSYQKASLDVIHRWVYPLVPDAQFAEDHSIIFQRNSVYKHESVNLSKGCKLESDVVINEGSKFGSNVKLTRSVVGKYCKIGDNVSIVDSFILDKASISSGSNLNLCVIGEGVIISANSTLMNCQLQHSVVITKQVDLCDKIIAKQKLDDSYEKLDEEAYIVSNATSDSDSEEDAAVAVTWLQNPEAESCDEEEESSVSDSEESRPASPEADDCTMFYSEVMDSLQRGYEEKLPCSNLILEVNSSRYAYNVTLSEVTQLTCKAMFALPSRLSCPAKPVLNYFQPLFLNYVKTSDGQMECLSAFEEMQASLGNELNICIHLLYNLDVLTEEVILKWYENLEDNDPLHSKLAKFIKWLEEAAEESDE